MNESVLFWFAGITTIGTAVLTVASVWKFLMGPLNHALQEIRETVQRLEARVEAGEARRVNDIKDIWKHLAERQETYRREH